MKNEQTNMGDTRILLWKTPPIWRRENHEPQKEKSQYIEAFIDDGDNP
jgi:hypothetical protein